jgi:SAM-dependent methyltransferase
MLYIGVMATDARAAADFYNTARGAMAARLVGDRLAALWPPTEMSPSVPLSVLGVGYAVPYLGLWRERAPSTIALTPAAGGAATRVLPSLPGVEKLSCLAEEDALPFPDLCFDRILLVHGLEAADHARRLLREVWRVMKDDGRLLVVVPNRMGLWAHAESTPFGHGQPYSPRQVERLLAESLFRVERREAALFIPPVNSRLLLRGARLWERGGRLMAPELAGVTITEGVKDVYAAVPQGAGLRRRIVLADAA